MHIREYRPSDNPSIVGLFFETVHTINAKDYTPEQLSVWAPDNIIIAKWCKVFEADYTVVAEEDGIIIGFANINCTGYLDRLYVDKNYQNMGVGKILTHTIEDYCQKNSLAIIFTDASITAKPFFLKMGYRVTKKNTVERGGQMLTNYTMVKKFPSLF